MNKVILSERSLTHFALNKLAGPFLFSPLGPRCVSCQKGNCQVHFVVNSHILCKWHNILLHSLEKHFHDFTHPMFFFSFLHIYYYQPNNDRKETSIDWYRFESYSISCHYESTCGIGQEKHSCSQHRTQPPNQYNAKYLLWNHISTII